MGSYRVELTRSAEKDLRCIDKGQIATIYGALETLAEDPRPHGVKKSFPAQTAHTAFALAATESSMKLKMLLWWFW